MVPSQSSALETRRQTIVIQSRMQPQLVGNICSTIAPLNAATRIQASHHITRLNSKQRMRSQFKTTYAVPTISAFDCDQPSIMPTKVDLLPLFGMVSVKELPNARQGQVVTRFSPEPSGYLDAGHVKAALINQYFTHVYQGKMIMRFDDTNPSTTSREYVDAYKEDLESLGITAHKISHASDYFQAMTDMATHLIEAGNMYPDDTPTVQMREDRAEGRDSVCRHRPVHQNMDIWRHMQLGDDEGSRYCLRFRMDMQAANKSLRDPVGFRVLDVPHWRTGTKFKAYPTYDFSCPFMDLAEHITHALRTIEFRDRDQQYYWIQDMMEPHVDHVMQAHVLAQQFEGVSMQRTVSAPPAVQHLTWTQVHHALLGTRLPSPTTEQDLSQAPAADNKQTPSNLTMPKEADVSISECCSTFSTAADINMDTARSTVAEAPAGKTERCTVAEAPAGEELDTADAHVLTDTATHSNSKDTTNAHAAASLQPHRQRPVLWEFSKIHFQYTPATKYQLRQLIEAGLVEGWDDPRLPTVRGLERLGLRPEALCAFLLEQVTPAKKPTYHSWDKLWKANSRILDASCARHMAISADHPVKVNIVPSQGEETAGSSSGDVTTKGKTTVHLRAGQRLAVCLSDTLLIEQEDAEKLQRGDTVMLLGRGLFKVLDVTKAANTTSEDTAQPSTGPVSSMVLVPAPGSAPHDATAKIHWIEQSEQVLKLQVLHYGHLLTKERVTEDDDVVPLFNHASKSDKVLLGSCTLTDCVKGEQIQLLRKGFVRVECPYVNATGQIVLIATPAGGKSC